MSKTKEEYEAAAMLLGMEYMGEFPFGDARGKQHVFRQEIRRISSYLCRYNYFYADTLEPVGGMQDIAQSPPLRMEPYSSDDPIP